jgi:hypothetical protein
MSIMEVRPDALVGKDGRRVAFDEMMRLERRHISVLRTTLLVGGILTLLAMAAVAAAYASLLSETGL